MTHARHAAVGFVARLADTALRYAFWSSVAHSVEPSLRCNADPTPDVGETAVRRLIGANGVRDEFVRTSVRLAEVVPGVRVTVAEGLLRVQWHDVSYVLPSGLLLTGDGFYEHRAGPEGYLWRADFDFGPGDGVVSHYWVAGEGRDPELTNWPPIGDWIQVRAREAGRDLIVCRDAFQFEYGESKMDGADRLFPTRILLRP